MEKLKCQYYEALKECLELLYNIEEWKRLSEEYEELKKEITHALLEADCIVSAAEMLIDKTSHELRPEAYALGISPELLDGAKRLATLYGKVKAAEERLPGDEAVSSCMLVVKIARYEECERMIIAMLGKSAGEDLIFEVKTEIAERERSLGLHFFTEQADAMRDLRRTRVLYPNVYEFNLPTVTADLDRKIMLADINGEAYEYHLTASIILGGKPYVELVHPDELLMRRRLSYYSVEQSGGGIAFRLVEDEELHATLSDITDRLL